MQPLARVARPAILVVFSFAALSGVGRTQRSGMPSIPGSSQSSTTAATPSGRVDPDTDERTTANREKLTKMRNDDRQKRLVADSDKLLELATQLHTDVAKTDKNILSLDVVHRAEEIEKLAHSVKERMKG